MKQYSRVYASVDLDAALHNMEAMYKLLKKDTSIYAVIKTDGYGHGAVAIAHKIEGLPYLLGFCVATVEEGLILRRHGVKKPILVLGYTFPEQSEDMIVNDIRPTVFTLEMAEKLSEVAVKVNRKCFIHVKVDTGMSRIGYQVSAEAAKEVAQIKALPNIVMEGIFTHFARADERDKTSAHMQYERFCEMIELCKKEGVEFSYRHCANSAGIVDLPECNMDVVRAGITLYGLWPSEEVIKERIDLWPLMEIKSRISFVKELPADREISYGGTFVTKDLMRIATIPVGYGDGYPRSLSNKGYVLIHGKKAPILGRVCMDQFMVDVTEIPEAKAGTTVTLLGQDMDARLTMEELGDISGRFNYEFACDVGKRVPRVFLEGGKIVSTKDYFGE